MARLMFLKTAEISREDHSETDPVPCNLDGPVGHNLREEKKEVESPKVVARLGLQSLTLGQGNTDLFIMLELTHYFYQHKLNCYLAKKYKYKQK